MRITTVWPDDLVSIACDLPDDIAVERIDLHSLPVDWHAAQHEPLRMLGDRWIRSERTLALYAPSAAIRGEWNVLLNPTHADFRRLKLHRPSRFEFDLRMFR